MLARNAEGLYWLARYLERGSHLCRLLASQVEFIDDRSVDDIDRGWRRIYGALGRTPLGSELQSSEGLEGVMLADAYTLADDLVFERQNPDSVTSSFAMARENARQVRTHISHEMWTCLNVAYLRMRQTRLLDIWERGIRAFLLSAAGTTREFSGWADTGMYRDHGWRFLRLGQFVERAQLVAALVETQIDLYPTADRHRSADWVSLLGICAAAEPFRRLHSIEYAPDEVIDFLVADPGLSNSVLHSLLELRLTAAAIAAGTPTSHAAAVVDRLDTTLRTLETDWASRDPADDSGARQRLGALRDHCQDLHFRIDRAWFHHAIEDIPDP